MIRIALILTYIAYCLKTGVKPWRYFQLNAHYFNENKGLFSKLDIDTLIPEQWRLSQQVDNNAIIVENYPVFLKPEWGQNSKGIYRADNASQLHQFRENRAHSSIQYLIQQSAPGRIEFEVFIIPLATDLTQLAHISITQVSNSSGDDFPINGIYNKDTAYRDITSDISNEDCQRFWGQLKQIGAFRIARYGIRSNSIEALLQGDFKIIEINLFVPMPLILLSNNITMINKLRFIVGAMRSLVEVTKTIPAQQKNKAILFKKLELLQQLKNIIKNNNTV